MLNLRSNTKKRQKALAFCHENKFKICLFQTTHMSPSIHYDYLGRCVTINDRNYLVKDHDGYYWSPTKSQYENDYYFDQAVWFDSITDVINFVTNRISKKEIKNTNVGIYNYYTEHYVGKFETFIKDLETLIKKGILS